MANKKAVSDIVTTILIILLALAAIVIVWAAVKKTVETGAGGMGSEKFSVGLSSKRTILSPVLSKVSVTRNAGQGEITGIKIIFKNATTSWTYENRLEIPKELETIEYLVDLTGNISDVLSYEVYPIIKQGAQETPGVKATIQPDVNGTGGCDAYCQLENAAVSYWKFEGNANDEKGAHNGLIVGDVDCSVAGINGQGKACSFDGDGDYIDLGASAIAANLNSFTISFWLPRTYDFEYALYSEANSVMEYNYLVLQNSGPVYLLAADSEGEYIQMQSNLAADWRQFVFVKHSPTTWELYEDGVSRYPHEPGFSFANILVDNVAIGRINSAEWAGISYYFNGIIDELMIFDRDLSASEILMIYNAQKGTPAACNYGAWQDVGCGEGGCSLGQMYQNRTKTAGGSECTATSQCVPNSTCELIGSAVSYWKFDDVSGANVPDSIGGNAGTIHGNVDCSVAGINGQGKACSFDGYGDYIDIPDITLGADRTYVAWIYTKDLLERHYFGTSSTQFYSDAYSGGVIAAICGAEGTFMPLLLNTWTFVAYSFNSSNLYEYVSGVSTSHTNSQCDESTQIFKVIGEGSDGTTQPQWSVNGNMDEVMIFDKSLTASEVQAIYDAQK